MMKVTLTGDADTLQSLAPACAPAAVPAAPGRLADYLELTKPRIAVMALFTVAIGYLLGAGSGANPRVLLHTLVGAGLVAAGGSALNQLLERRIDARMRRTANRPLPAGRLSPEQAAAFGAVLSGAGLAYLLATVPLAAFLAAAVTFVTYVLVYTPLKTRTAWNTAVGAVPGAMPPVIGWCAARGWDGAGGAAVLFAVLFLWQLPHFMAIAWMYRDDYAAGGLRMLPGSDPTGGRTAAVMTLTAASLVPLGFVAAAVGIGGWVSAAGAVLAGAYFLRRAVGFARDRSDRQARRVLRASLLYLPVVFALFLAGCGAAARPDPDRPRPEVDPGYQVGPFSLTERSGRTVTDKDLRGSVWVASFVFTRCNGPCPAVTSTVARLQHEFRDEPRVKFVTFTVDPARDDLAALRTYAANRNADPERWLFLTGDEAAVHKILREQFKQAAARNPKPGEQPGDEFEHSTKLAVVDRDGVIRGFYDGLANDNFPDEMFEENLARLKEKVRKLLP